MKPVLILLLVAILGGAAVYNYRTDLVESSRRRSLSEEDRLKFDAYVTARKYFLENWNPETHVRFVPWDGDLIYARQFPSNHTWMAEGVVESKVDGKFVKLPWISSFDPETKKCIVWAVGEKVRPTKDVLEAAEVERKKPKSSNVPAAPLVPLVKPSWSPKSTTLDSRSSGLGNRSPR